MSDFKPFTLNLKTEFKLPDESSKISIDGLVIKGLAVAGHDDAENIDEVKVYINNGVLIDLYSKLFGINASNLVIRTNPSTQPVDDGEYYTMIEVRAGGVS